MLVLHIEKLNDSQGISEDATDIKLARTLEENLARVNVGFIGFGWTCKMQKKWQIGGKLWKMQNEDSSHS